MTKNPACSEVTWIDAPIGPDTVNPVPVEPFNESFDQLRVALAPRSSAGSRERNLSSKEQLGWQELDGDSLKAAS